MITSQNIQNSAKYSKLFTDAFELLKEEGKLTEEEIEMGGFTRLEEYFTRIGDLAGMHATEVSTVKETDGIFKLNNNVDYAKYAKYLMLPLDETPFEINANSRQITVPDNFKKYGVSLHGDQIAETLLFRIDRFFDFNDLLTTTIFVQWTRPGTEPESEREGASLITLVDYESEPGKLWLGWPLTSEITKAAGPLKFSLRFFKKDPETNVISYSLNTLTAQVNINPALHPDLNNNLKIDEASVLFVDAVQNSPSSGSTPALRPVFIVNLEEKAWLVDDALTLAVTSYTGDTGVLTYQWYKASIIGVDEEGNYITDNTTEITADSKTELRETSDATRDEKKTYYLDGNEGAGIPYTGNFTNGKTEDGAQVYERYSVYEMPKSPAEVTGLYYVVAQNRAGTSTELQKSQYCEIPRPKTLEFVGNDALDARAFIDDNGSVALTAIATPDDPAHASISYQWLKTTTLDGKYTEVVDNEGNPISTGSILALVAPDTENGEKVDKHIGWYKVIATNVVNRQPMSITSDPVCKVTGHPGTPIITSPETEDTITLVKGTDDVDGIFTLTVSVEDLGGPLYNEYYTYNWFHSITDGDPVAVAEGDADIVSTDIHNKELKVKLTSGDEVEYYFCEVYNNLNNEQSSPVTTGLFRVTAQ